MFACTAQFQKGWKDFPFLGDLKVETGATDSTSLHFEIAHKWSGLLIEPVARLESSSKDNIPPTLAAYMPRLLIKADGLGQSTHASRQLQNLKQSTGLMTSMISPYRSLFEEKADCGFDIYSSTRFTFLCLSVCLSVCMSVHKCDMLLHFQMFSTIQTLYIF